MKKRVLLVLGLYLCSMTVLGSLKTRAGRMGQRFQVRREGAMRP